jgi:hypothetical protein
MAAVLVPPREPPRVSRTDLSDARGLARLGQRLGERWHTAVLARAVQIVDERVDRQVRLDNPPTAIFVDGRQGKPVLQMKGRIVVAFGMIDVRSAMNRTKEIVDATTNVPHRWIAGAGGPRVEQQLAGAGPVFLAGGESVMLVSGNEGLPVANIYFKFGFDIRSQLPGLDLNRAIPHERRRSPQQEGFIAAASRRANAAAGPGLYVRAVFASGTDLGRASRFTFKPGFKQGTARSCSAARRRPDAAGRARQAAAAGRDRRAVPVPSGSTGDARAMPVSQEVVELRLEGADALAETRRLVDASNRLARQLGLAGKSANEMQRDLRQVAEAAQRTERQMGGLSRSVAFLGRAFAGYAATRISFDTFREGAQRVRELASEIEQTEVRAQRLGTSFKALDTFQTAFKIAGLDPQRVEEIARELRVRIYEALEDPKGEQASLFRYLELDPSTLRGITDATDLLRTYAGAVGRVEELGDAIAVVDAQLSDAGTESIEVLRNFDTFLFQSSKARQSITDATGAETRAALAAQRAEQAELEAQWLAFQPLVLELSNSVRDLQIAFLDAFGPQVAQATREVADVLTFLSGLTVDRLIGSWREWMVWVLDTDDILRSIGYTLQDLGVIGDEAFGGKIARQIRQIQSINAEIIAKMKEVGDTTSAEYQRMADALAFNNGKIAELEEALRRAGVAGRTALTGLTDEALALAKALSGTAQVASRIEGAFDAVKVNVEPTIEGNPGKFVEDLRDSVGGGADAPELFYLRPSLSGGYGDVCVALDKAARAHRDCRVVPLSAAVDTRSVATATETVARTVRTSVPVIQPFDVGAADMRGLSSTGVAIEQVTASVERLEGAMSDATLAGGAMTDALTPRNPDMLRSVRENAADVRRIADLLREEQRLIAASGKDQSRLPGGVSLSPVAAANVELLQEKGRTAAEAERPVEAARQNAQATGDLVAATSAADSVVKAAAVAAGKSPILSPAAVATYQALADNANKTKDAADRIVVTNDGLARTEAEIAAGTEKTAAATEDAAKAQAEYQRNLAEFRRQVGLDKEPAVPAVPVAAIPLPRARPSVPAVALPAVPSVPPVPAYAPVPDEQLAEKTGAVIQTRERVAEAETRVATARTQTATATTALVDAEQRQAAAMASYTFSAETMAQAQRTALELVNQTRPAYETIIPVLDQLDAMLRQGIITQQEWYGAAQQLASSFGVQADGTALLAARQAELNALMERGAITAGQASAAMASYKDSLSGAGGQANIVAGFGDVLGDSFASLATSLVNGEKAGKAFFSTLIQGLARLASQLLSQAIQNAFKSFGAVGGAPGAVPTAGTGGGFLGGILGGLGSIFGKLFGFAKGAAVGPTGLAHGVYNQPTYFPLSTPGFHAYARGVGVMGEAGHEAILPLRRGRGGRLGVEAGGALAANVTVINNTEYGAKVRQEHDRTLVEISADEGSRRGVRSVTAGVAKGQSRLTASLETAYGLKRKGRR